MKLHWREMWFCFQEFVFVSRETEDLKNPMWIIWIPYTCEYFTTLLLLHSAAGLLLTRPGILPYRFVIDLVISVHACGMLHSSTTVTFTVHHHAIIILSFISDPISSCYYCQHHCLWKIWGHPRRCWGSCSPGKADMMSISWSRPKQLPEESGFFFCCANLVTRVMC